MGVVGDFVFNLTQRNVDKANGGTFAGQENRFFPREIELSFFGQVDPYARGEVRIEAAEEFEDGASEIHLGLAEAHLTFLTMPFHAGNWPHAQPLASQPASSPRRPQITGRTSSPASSARKVSSSGRGADLTALPFRRAAR
jgi:hypothetical protein